MIYSIKKFCFNHLNNFIYRKEDILSFKGVDNLNDSIINFLNKNISYTLLYDNETVFIISFDILWNGVAELWGITNNNFLDYYLSIFRYSKEIIDFIIVLHSLHRLQCHILKTFYKSHRMIKFLKFEKEAILYNYGPSKETYIQYVRIING